MLLQCGFSIEDIADRLKITIGQVRQGTGSAAWALEKVAETGIQEMGDRAEY